MTRISPEKAAAEYGMQCHHEQMPNGETRFRLSGNDGSGYIKTVAGQEGAWQNSHRHQHITEIYIVQSGWMAMAYATQDNTQIQLERHLAGEIIRIGPGIRHNTYLPAHAVIHVIKQDIPANGDWIADPELDSLSKPVSEAQILQQTGNSDLSAGK
ncbi:hypothetical protein [Aliamphritea hakodatensis]|uniref:hypothetical protein n=1 Tax=Aliamphritea hakodatensis TaxID=2895352 RepID=UPI0022FD3961|nr:hypothetical protein [Aliamphritea hakodatensis]